MEKQPYYSGTKVGVWRAVFLCILAVVSPKQFARANEKDAIALIPTLQSAQAEPGARVVFRAFWLSLLAVIASMLGGLFLGRLSFSFLGCASAGAMTTLAVIGAGVFLWGTLFVRGWQVQTNKGVSLAERVNQWLYRTLYCSGTAVVVWSATWPGCK